MRLEPKVEKQLCERFLRTFLDIVILYRLENSEPMSGYGFLQFIHEKFGILLSSGTVYSNLYALEREGFIEGHSRPRKRVYKVSDKGRQFIEATCHALSSVQNLIKKVMKERRS